MASRPKLDLRETLVRVTGEIQVGDIEKHLCDTLSDAGFLEDEDFEQLRIAKSGSSRRARREATHAGSAYPDKSRKRRARSLGEFMQGRPPETAAMG